MGGEVGFIHVRAHSAYSLLEGALPLGKLIEAAKADAQPALGLVDTGNLFGALEFSEKASEKGIQPIVGCQVAVDFGEPVEPGRRTALNPKRPALVLIAATAEGWANLVRIVSHSFLGTEGTEDAHVSVDFLGGHAGGLIVLSGGPGGPIDRAFAEGRADLARARLERLAHLFGDRLYVELQRHMVEAEQAVEADLIDLAYDLHLALVATNEPFFRNREDFEAHDALIAISEGRVVAEEDRRRLTPEHGFKSRAEMVALFADLPEALANTIEIARRCSYRPLKRKPILPRFAGVGQDAETAEREEALELRAQAEAGLEQRLAIHGTAPGLSVQDYRERLAFELSIIVRMKFPGYFLIVSDFIKWAKAQGIPVGPGRGSGAGSLVAWSLTITDLDPLRFALLFERFLNPERVSMPDFDIDFCQDRRDEVIRYVQQKYGRDQVAQIITFGTLQARAVLRDVGRVLQMSYGQVDRLAKLVPQNPANPVTLAQAVSDEPRLQEAREQEAIVEKLLDIAMKLEGLYRHASTHAAGIVIGDRRLDDLVPLYRDPRSDMPVTQFNMKWVESAGLVKFDFLGLKTLTVLQTAVALVLKEHGRAVDLSALPFDDPKTYQLLAKGETVGVFQLESQGMRKAIADIKPDRFEDIIALVALYRPGPMANIPVYGARKQGLETPDYLHPLLEPVLKETYGIIVYQEQVMQIAQLLSGYSLGEADLLRRAMGKKIKAEMDAQRARFVDGALKQGLAREQADTIFDLLAKFADYGFNKSHAAAYALVAYQTAWMKANYPVEFLAASMTLDMSNTDKLSDFRREAMRLSIPVMAPDIRRSGTAFDADNGRIIYALAAVKGVGTQAVDHLVAVRSERPFRDISDFARRIDPRQLNKRTLESLVAAGAFDGLEPDRGRLFHGLDQIVGEANRVRKDSEDGHFDMFAGGGAEKPLRLPEQGWTPAEQLQREHAAIGFYLSAHPLDEYRKVLEEQRVQMWAEFQESVKRGGNFGRLAGTVTSRQERKTKTGNKMGIVRMSDPTGQYEAVIFSEGLSNYRDLLETGRSIILYANAEERAEGISVRIEKVEPLEVIASRSKQNLRIFLRDPKPIESLGKQLEPRGEGEVSFVLLVGAGEREVEVKLPGKWRVSPQVAGALKAVPGVVQVQVV
ncbi:DNA polymerase III subunit alpha [Prosthecodimorpha staleyi]|uniref:DNA polymerase III subunit alpha n=1 Tax=Prosthecodimorpha staleyi TaxID=2840188 RepID=UPI0021C34F45|nr:DNA polymerase III subunit alpha [Prosthecodimorpha staleyi]